jgi:glycosyltransferase involved in cell wall biosynthesis
MVTVSALICTRNRPVSLLRAVQSILATPDASLEVIVVDQSDNAESRRALDVLGADARLRYVQSCTRGKGSALNEGLCLAESDIVVCSDDDCEMSSGWVTEMARVAEAHSQAAVVFCTVTAANHDRTVGYVPVFERHSDRLLTSIADARGWLGLGAGMALRREAVLSLGGFDESLGPGARFPSGDDWDITIRALLGGWQVFVASGLSVLHHGFRTFAEGREHAFRDWLAIGALCAKPIRAGHLRVAGLALWLFSVEGIAPVAIDVLHLRRPRGFARILGFTRGFMSGMVTPVDRKTLVFKSRKPQ